MQSKNKLLIIGLGTYKRPQMLRETLLSFCNLEVPKEYEVQLLVADNDPDLSAKSTVEECIGKISIYTEYVMAKDRGIVFMRNMILEMALERNANLMAFIDDDELIEPDWLKVMLQRKAEFQADVVVGRVDRILPEDTPTWILKGQFFERPSIPTGSVRHAASTSNVIFELDLICKTMGLRFHPALNLSGSSDTYLFGQATEKGAKIVWVNDNLIKETIPKSRMTVDWLLKRAFRHNNCRTLRARLKYSYVRAFVSETIYGSAHLIIGVLMFPFFIFMGKAGVVHCLRWLWKGAGSFAGLTGYVYKEYQHTHGN